MLPQGDMKERFMSVHDASKQIVDTLLIWEGMEAHQHRFGGTEFRSGKCEIGHLHGDSLIDIPFPKKIRDEIVVGGAGEAQRITFCRKQVGSIIT